VTRIRRGVRVVLELGNYRSSIDWPFPQDSAGVRSPSPTIALIMLYMVVPLLVVAAIQYSVQEYDTTTQIKE